MDGQTAMENLKATVKELVALYESSETERRRLEILVADQNKKLIQNEEQIKELEKKIDDLQLIEAFRDESSGAEAKKRVTVLIREIDKCIALLNE